MQVLVHKLGPHQGHQGIPILQQDIQLTLKISRPPVQIIDDHIISTAPAFALESVHHHGKKGGVIRNQAIGAVHDKMNLPLLGRLQISHLAGSLKDFLCRPGIYSFFPVQGIGYGCR